MPVRQQVDDVCVGVLYGEHEGGVAKLVLSVHLQLRQRHQQPDSAAIALSIHPIPFWVSDFHSLHAKISVVTACLTTSVWPSLAATISPVLPSLFSTVLRSQPLRRTRLTCSHSHLSLSRLATKATRAAGGEDVFPGEGHQSRRLSGTLHLVPR